MGPLHLCLLSPSIVRTHVGYVWCTGFNTLGFPKLSFYNDKNVEKPPQVFAHAESFKNGMQAQISPWSGYFDRFRIKVKDAELHTIF